MLLWTITKEKCKFVSSRGRTGAGGMLLWTITKEKCKFVSSRGRTGAFSSTAIFM